MKNLYSNIKQFIKICFHYFFPIRFDDLESFISAAYSFEYKVTIKEKFWPDPQNEFFQTEYSCGYQGGAIYLELRGKKKDCFNIVYDYCLGRFDPYLGRSCEDRKKEIIEKLDALNLMSSRSSEQREEAVEEVRAGVSANV